ncbi:MULTISPECIES: LirA/MavJ family T4SS effector [unclassified Legionella]|uniref:LirA/MavJ family T4SS effector n=1 Tax=unclassified Legionella TaxID=2622702 RepID=UPI00105589B6|nr:MULTISPECIES: LirA/MavJ family T4SS effector [unclassified Legionella]MDI9818689.1 hypothetical protein [Legionella sp. PL877]
MRRYRKFSPPTAVNPEQWKPDEEKISKVENIINYRFDNNTKSNLIDLSLGEVKAVRPDEEFMHACARIGAFLMDKQAVLQHLKALDNLLGTKKSQVPNAELSVSILRETLEDELGKNGFNPHFGKTLENVRPEIFRAAIAHGLLLKDAAVGDTRHGEFAHLIQWLAIAWQQEASNFLSKPVIELFRQLGKESSVYYRDPISSKDESIRREENSIWDIIVDSEGDNDFRSPEVLTSFILDSKELPNLSELLQKRLDKRRQQPEQLTEKYKSISSLSSPRLFSRKNGKMPYWGGNLQGMLEPEDSKIDLDEFKKANHYPKPGGK